MKQVAQRSRDGRIVVIDAPIPTIRNGWVLVSNVCSLISPGTERSKIELGAMNIGRKARARPDLTKKVLERARSEGIRSTVAAVRDRLDSLAPLGYSSAGIVQELGRGVEGLAPGDRVACAGGGWANHAEVVAVPKNLVAKMPAGVPFEDAAYGTVGAIALHGVRQSAATVGERIGVIGLGLVGQLALRILLAAGCQSVGIDRDPAAVDLAAASGATALIRDDRRVVPAVLELTENLGLDAILICAAGRSSDPIELAARLARDRGRLVIVGDVLIAVDRALLYEKELELRLSRSYGPGRYDRDYEEHGRDLPAGYVRWTEQRNLQAFLQLIASGRLEPSTLTTHRFPVERAADAYSVLTGSSSGTRPFGILLEYRHEPEPLPPQDHGRRPVARPQKSRIGVIGAGSFARRVLLPAIRANDAQLVAVATEGGLSAADVASRFGFERASLAEEICAAEDLDAVVIATRHSSHSALVATALHAGKAVFVEKPLALDWDQLKDVENALGPSSLLIVGFNRRFAPLTERLRAALPPTSENVLFARVNAGPLPRDHWLNDAEEGGGRLIGEGCHFVDLLTYIAGAPATMVYAVATPDPELASELAQSFSATLRCANGALASILYASNGDTRLPKERVEGYGGGVAAVLDDFRRLDVYEDGKKKTVKGRADKGHRAQLDCFLEALRGEAEPPPIHTYLASTRATLALAESLRTGRPIEVH
jgi:predicted dehydrogenase